MERKVKKLKPWWMYSYAEMNRIKRKDCVSCIYKAGSKNENHGSSISCDYIGIERHSRPCQPGQCRDAEVWKPKTRARKQRAIRLSNE